MYKDKVNGAVYFSSIGIRSRFLAIRLGELYRSEKGAMTESNWQPLEDWLYSLTPFYSYSHADKSFARRLHDGLQGRGIRCWLDEHQMVPGQDIYAEPWAFDLHTGNSKTRSHPLTGEDSEWRFSRPGHHCGVITATPNMMFFRSGFIGYYDLYNDSGTRHFAGQRLGCWINAIPGNGLVMIPEASAGCVCQFSIASTVVMEPKTDNKSWGIFSAVGPTTPVKRMGINFGAPGDRKDKSAREWFGYPRPRISGRLEFVFDVQPKIAAGGGWYSRNAESFEILNTDTPWLYTSGARGLSQFELPLLGADDPKSKYTVKLHFAELNTDRSGMFDVRLQGTAVAQNVDIAAESGQHRANIKEFTDVTVDRNLLVELVSHDKDAPATLAAIEVIRQD